jgi:hypothetical protein
VTLVLRTGLRGLPDRPPARRAKHRTVLSWTSAPLQSIACTDCCRSSPPLEVCSPFDASGNGKRPTPGLPHPAVRRLQAFSASWRFIPPGAVPALFRTGNALGVRPSEVCSSRVPTTPLGSSAPRGVACKKTRRSWPTRCGIRSPGTAPYKRPTRHRVNMPAPTCVLARDVPDPSVAPVLWMGTSTRRALQRHSARRSSQQSFRRSHHPTGLPPGFPVETPRFGGRREVSPSCARWRRVAVRGPRASSRRLDEAQSHRGARFPRTVTGRSDRSAWLRPGPFPSVVESTRRARREWSGTAKTESSCTLPHSRAPEATVTLPDLWG